MKIVFTRINNLATEFAPKPAALEIPDWFKNMPSYQNDKKMPSENNETNGTIKRCMPVFDAITAGYILYTPTDVYVTHKDGHPFYQWSSGTTLNFHPVEQAPTHPYNTGHKLMYPKWMNPWGIKTPKGYSILITQPFHRDSLFHILPGIVDTDKYYAPINFPFVLKDPEWEGLIPAGSPMAQIIPFKRDTWQMEEGTEQDHAAMTKFLFNLRVRFFDNYKTRFRDFRQYK